VGERKTVWPEWGGNRAKDPWLTAPWKEPDRQIERSTRIGERSRTKNGGERKNHVSEQQSSHQNGHQRTSCFSKLETKKIIVGCALVRKKKRRGQRRGGVKCSGDLGTEADKRRLPPWQNSVVYSRARQCWTQAEKGGESHKKKVGEKKKGKNVNLPRRYEWLRKVVGGVGHLFSGSDYLL